MSIQKWILIYDVSDTCLWHLTLEVNKLLCVLTFLVNMASVDSQIGWPQSLFLCYSELRTGYSKSTSCLEDFLNPWVYFNHSPRAAPRLHNTTTKVTNTVTVRVRKASCLVYGQTSPLSNTSKVTYLGVSLIHAETWADPWNGLFCRGVFGTLGA